MDGIDDGCDQLGMQETRLETSELTWILNEMHQGDLLILTRVHYIRDEIGSDFKFNRGGMTRVG